MKIIKRNQTVESGSKVKLRTDLSIDEVKYLLVDFSVNDRIIEDMLRNPSKVYTTQEERSSSISLRFEEFKNRGANNIPVSVLQYYDSILDEVEEI